MHKEMQTGRPMAGQPTAEPNHRLPERTAFFPSLRFGEERLRSFRSRRYFGSADGWPAEGRPAGGRARCTTREGRLTADFDGRREKTVSNQKRHQLSRFDRQQAYARSRPRREEQRAVPLGARGSHRREDQRSNAEGRDISADAWTTGQTQGCGLGRAARQARRPEPARGG